MLTETPEYTLEQLKVKHQEEAKQLRWRFEMKMEDGHKAIFILQAYPIKTKLKGVLKKVYTYQRNLYGNYVLIDESESGYRI